MENITSVLRYIGLNNFISIIGVGAAFFIALQSLNFSKRTFIVKDYYEPILDEMKQNSNIKFQSKSKFKFDKLNEVYESYIGAGFEKKQIRMMKKILQLSHELNVFKDQSNHFCENIIISVLKEKLPKPVESDMEVMEIRLFYNNKDLLNMIFYPGIELYYLQNFIGIEVVYGNEIVTDDGYFPNQNNLSLNRYLQETYDIDIEEIQNELERSINKDELFLEGIDDLILEQMEGNEDYKNSVDKFNKLNKNIKNLTIEFNESLRELLIPWYKFKKLCKKVIFIKS